MKARMGATHFLMRTLPKVATEMALSVLAYNLTRVMNIVGIKPLIAAMRPETASLWPLWGCRAAGDGHIMDDLKVVLRVGDGLVVGHRSPLRRAGRSSERRARALCASSVGGCKAGSVAFADKLVHRKADLDSDGDAAVGAQRKCSPNKGGKDG
jgi:hypothetical protein